MAMSHQHTPVSASVIKSTSRLAPKAVPRKKKQQSSVPPQPALPPPRATPAPTVDEDGNNKDQPDQIESQINPSLQVTQPATRVSQRRLHPADDSSATTTKITATGVGIPTTEPSIPSSGTLLSTQRTSSSAPTRTLRSSGSISETDHGPTSVGSSLLTAVSATTATTTATTTNAITTIAALTKSRKRGSTTTNAPAKSSPRRNRRKSTPPSAEQVEISPATMTMSEMCVDKRTGRKSARFAELQEAERQRKRMRQLKRDQQEANGIQNDTPTPDFVPTAPTTTSTAPELIPSLEEDDSLLPVTSGTAAQLMTDLEGNIVLDRTSLRVDFHAVHPTTLTDSLTHTTETVFSSKTNSSTYPSTRKYASNAVRWLPADTQRFYTALQMFGTDFGMVADYLGGGKTRRHVKNKFDREEKRNPEKLTWALRNRIEPDISGLEETRGRRIRRIDDVELKETLAGIREEARAIMALPSLSQSDAAAEQMPILD